MENQSHGRQALRGDSFRKLACVKTSIPVLLQLEQSGGIPRNRDEVVERTAFGMGVRVYLFYLL